MIAFEVRVNRKKLTTAGLPGDGILSVLVTSQEKLLLEVGGVVNNEHLIWLHEELRAGDKVTIAIVERDEVDMPGARYHDDAEVVEQAEREYYEQLKAKYEGL